MPVDVDHARRSLPSDNPSRWNGFAAIRSRFGDNMNSIVSPPRTIRLRNSLLIL